MASKRDYAYYIKGNKIAIIERGIGSGVCSLSGYSNQTTCEAAGGTWTENAISNDDGEWMSPIATIADGLEIQYAYSPRYNIQQTDDKDTNITQYRANGGYLQIADNTSAYTNYGSSPTLVAGNTLVLRKAGRFDGPHVIRALGNSGGTNNMITLETAYNGLNATWTNFEETVELYYTVDGLNSEADTIDLPEYQAKAVVYYLKAKLAEDAGDMEMREFFMREFKRQLEKGVSALKRGPYMVQGFKEMR